MNLVVHFEFMIGLINTLCTTKYIFTLSGSATKQLDVYTTYRFSLMFTFGTPGFYFWSFSHIFVPPVFYFFCPLDSVLCTSSFIYSAFGIRRMDTTLSKRNVGTLKLRLSILPYLEVTRITNLDWKTKCFELRDWSETLWNRQIYKE